MVADLEGGIGLFISACTVCRFMKSKLQIKGEKRCGGKGGFSLYSSLEGLTTTSNKRLEIQNFQ